MRLLKSVKRYGRDADNRLGLINIKKATIIAIMAFLFLFNASTYHKCLKQLL